MEIIQIEKNIHNSPRKVRLVVDAIKKLKPEVALKILQFTKKAAALPLAKAIKAVLGNAKSQNADINQMVFKSIEVNEGLKMKRYRAGTKGRVKPYRKRMSQIKIILTDEKSQKIENNEDKNLETKEVKLDNGKKS